MSADPLFDRLARALAGRYHLTRELGQGGMATVYLGTDLKLNRQVAIKVLPPTTRAYLGSGRFQREVLLAAQLSHPHIVPLFEADEADGILFYVMGYVEGESLKDRLAREGALPLDDAVRIAAEVGDALQYAHERGVLHRDIKPANILLSREHAMVTDFGIAKLMEQAAVGQSSLTGAGLTPGTAEYMSPEQAGGAEHLDARSDVYALAAVLYEMLVGEPPFTGPSVQAVVARVLTERPRPIHTVRPDVPLSLERAVAAGLAKVPADRPASARAFVTMVTRPRAGRRSTIRQLGWASLVAVAVVTVVWGAVRSAGRRAAPSGTVLVPAGPYPVGGRPWRSATTVRLDAFRIDSTEVTVGAYQRYLDSTAAPTPWTGKPPDEWPVTGVLWSEAVAYCRWRDPLGRLPTEDEWEAAARGTDARAYPWGNGWEAGRANAASATDTLVPVASFPLGRSWVGAVDLIGNAWEWVATDSAGERGEPLHVIKGGAFDTPPKNATAAFRAWLPEDRRTLWKTGFRCARAK
jgi:formylglycine-generating enzyme required for sulfatase activity